MKKTLILFLAWFFVIPAYTQYVDSGALEKHVTYLASDSLLGRGFGTEQGQIASGYIAAQFEKAGIQPLLDSYFDPFDYRTSTLNIRGRNVVGLIPGSDPELKKEFIVLGAHYDHVGWELSNGDTIVYNGADDNASGTASIIEIGRYLSENRDALSRSVILIAFDGEETGLIGSRNFMKDSLVPPESIKAMFSLDMVGMYHTHGGVELNGLELITSHEQLLEKATSQVDINLAKVNGNVPYRTDTAPFASRGIPSIHVFTGTESPYHEPEDDSDLLEYDGMALINDFLIELTLLLANEPEIPYDQSLEEAREGKSMKIFHAGVRLNTGGSHHNYPEEFFKANGVFAGGAGFFIQTRIAQFLSIQPEVLYELQGSKHEQGTLRTHSVTTPVSLMLTTPDPANTGFRSFLQFGGYYSYAFHGTIDGEQFEFGDTFNEQEFGLLFGIGVEADFMRVSVLFKRAITDFTTETAVPVKPVATFYSLAYVF